MNEKFDNNRFSANDLHHTNDSNESKERWTAKQLGIEAVFEKVITLFDKLEFEIIKKDDEAGTIEVNGYFFKNSESTNRKFVIANFKTKNIKNAEEIKNYKKKIPNEVTTKHNNLLPKFENKQTVDEIALGIDLPLNEYGIIVEITIIENKQNGIVEVKIELNKGITKDFKVMTINNFKSLHLQNIDDVWEIKQRFDKLQNSKTSLVNVAVNTFVLKSYSKAQLGFINEPQNLNSVTIKSYTVKAIDQNGFLLIEVSLQKGQANYFAHFSLSGFISPNPNEKINQEFDKIKNYLKTLHNSSAFNLQQENYTDRTWSYIWNMLLDHLIKEKKFEKAIVHQIQWLTLDEKKQPQSQQLMLINEFNTTKSLINKIFRIWVQDNPPNDIKIDFKNFLTDEAMVDKIINIWKARRGNLLLKVDDNSQFKNQFAKSFLDKQAPNKIAVSWQEVLSWKIEDYNPFKDYENLNIFAQSSTVMEKKGACKFLLFIGKNNFYYKKKHTMTIEGFKPT